MSDPFSTPGIQLDLAGLSVMLAMPTHRDLHPLTVASLLNTQTACYERGVPLTVEIDHGGSLVHHARTKMAWRFLRGKHNRLFWVDSDMVWRPEDFIRLLALSTRLPLVAGAYTAKQDQPLFMVKHPDLSLMEANEYGCIRFDGLGLGFTCCVRAAVEALAEAAPRKRYHGIEELVPAIFRLDGVDRKGGDLGEDMAFFLDAKAAGFDLWVDPTVKLGHVGPKAYEARLQDYLAAAQPVETSVSSAA